ncbi:MAG: hypothetical protein WC247_05650 [Porticoccaceae bacterium]|jgi:hypothetical protein
MLSDDQAAGLRQWAADQPGERAPDIGSRQGAMTLMVIGLPDTSPRQLLRVAEVLAQWAAAGSRWVGDPGRWRVVPVDPASPYLPVLATEQRRWALWVETDGDGFRRGYGVLRQLAERRGPRRLLAIHPPDIPRRGLLDNLQQAAAAYLDIDLVVLAG